MAEDRERSHEEFLKELEVLRGENAALRRELREAQARCNQSRELMEQEHQELLSIFDSIDEAVYVVDPDTYEILYVNQAIRNIFGDQELVGKKCYEVFQALQYPCSFCTNERIFGDNLGASYIWDFQNRFNRRWYHCIDKAIRWPDGRMVRCEMAIDITERKRVEEALRNSKRLLERALYNLRDAVFFLDVGLTKIVDCNPSTLKMFGYSRSELLGLDIRALFVDDGAFQKCKEQLCATLVEKDILSNVDCNMKRKDGSIFLSRHNAMPLEDEQGNQIGWICIVAYLGEPT